VSSPRDLLRALRSLPLWLRWLLTIAFYAALVVAVVAVVRGGGGSGGGSASASEARAEAEANRVARVAIGDDEAPHSARARAGVSARAALADAIAADVRARIRHRALGGPLQGVRCAAPGRALRGRREMRCTVRSGGVSYPFVGVLDGRSGELTWCKIDPPAVAGEPLEVPVSGRCRA